MATLSVTTRFIIPRNVSSERSEARRKLRECSGLVDSIMYIVQSQIDRKDVDNKVTGVYCGHRVQLSVLALFGPSAAPSVCDLIAHG